MCVADYHSALKNFREERNKLKKQKDQYGFTQKEPYKIEGFLPNPFKESTYEDIGSGVTKGATYVGKKTAKGAKYVGEKGGEWLAEQIPNPFPMTILPKVTLIPDFGIPDDLNLEKAFEMPLIPNKKNRIDKPNYGALDDVLEFSTEELANKSITKITDTVESVVTAFNDSFQIVFESLETTIHHLSFAFSKLLFVIIDWKGIYEFLKQEIAKITSLPIKISSVFFSKMSSFVLQVIDILKKPLANISTYIIHSIGKVIQNVTKLYKAISQLSNTIINNAFKNILYIFYEKSVSLSDKVIPLPISKTTKFLVCIILVFTVVFYGQLAILNKFTSY